MDRVTAYSGELPISTDFLQSQQNAMVALAKLTESLCGTTAFVTGLGCTPTTPTPNLSVVLAAGNIYQQVSLEATTWSGVAADTTDKIVKQGIALAAQSLAFTPPATGGFSQVFLIEAQYQDLDSGSKVLPYFNPAVLTSPGSSNWSGPGNSGAAQNTARKGIVAVQIKAGVAAATGTQVAPTVDTGWVPLWNITVANGQTQITSGSIAQATGAPFLTSTLNSVPAFVQSGAALYAVDTGAANALTVAPNPAPAAIVAGMQLRTKVNNTVTGASTLAVTLASGTQTNNITRADASATQRGDLLAGQEVDLSFDGTQWQIPSPAIGAQKRTAVADANFPVTVADRIVAYTSITAARTVTLLAAASYAPGTIIAIRDDSGSVSAANTISVAPNGAETINGSNTTQVVLNSAFASVALETDGVSKWSVSKTIVAPFPGYASGVFVTGEVLGAGSAGTVALAANTLYAFPLLMNGAATWTTLGINVTATGTAANVKLGIFNAGSDGLPSTLVVDGGSVAVGTTGTKTVSINQALPPGLYYAVVVADGTLTVTAGTLVAINAAAGNKWVEAIGVTAFAAYDVQLSKAFTFGVLSGATPFGAPTRAAAAIPVVALKK